MPQHVLITFPEYAERFQCIGGACEDTCCQGWAVNVDKNSFEKYQALPPGELKVLVDARVKKRDNSPDQAYASIQLLPDGVCPFLTSDRLCMIQAECGEAYLCSTCKFFPRSMNTFFGVTENPLSLSCPEAARLVLCDPKLLHPGKGTYRETWDETNTEQRPFKLYFLQIRESAIAIIRQQRFSLWQRLFLMGIFARRLDAIARGEVLRDIPSFLRDFALAADSPDLHAAMKVIPANPALQLEIVVRLVNLRSSPIKPSPRLLECLEHFAVGIGIQPGISRESQIETYQAAFAQYYEPFFNRHPHMLENYICNEIFRGTFPFGRALFSNDPKTLPDCARSHAMMMIQFALIKGLLIGNAAYHKKSFATVHVVDVVQTAFKHFEHNWNFLLDAYELLAQTRLVEPQGLAMLLRN